MAEKMLQSFMRDSNGDGIPDIMDRLQEDEKFGPSKANWKFRRALVIAIIVTSYGSCLLMVAIWAYTTLFTDKDMPRNLVEFGTTMFWAMNLTGTSVLGLYLGIAQADTSSYRKEMGRLAAVLPPTPQQPAYVDPNCPPAYQSYTPPPYTGGGQSYPNNNYVVGSPGPPSPLPNPPTPINPGAASEDMGGPTTPKPGIII